jgi:hypothetical protein
MNKIILSIICGVFVNVIAEAQVKAEPVPNTSPLLTYSNTDFNQIQPGWADTLTIYNETNSPVVLTQ